MSNFVVSLKAEALRSIAFGGISGTYANVGTATLHPWKIIFIANTTDADVIISLDGGVTDNFVIPTKQAIKIDASANGLENNEYLKQGTQFAVKQVTAPGSGSVYVSGMYT